MQRARRNVQRWIVDAVQRIAALEYRLVDAYHAAAQSATGFVSASLATCAGAAQVHLFDLGTVLRELGDESLSYGRCARQTLRPGDSTDRVLRRLERESKRMAEHDDVPVGLRALLHANLAEHRSLLPLRAIQLAHIPLQRSTR